MRELADLSNDTSAGPPGLSPTMEQTQEHHLTLYGWPPPFWSTVEDQVIRGFTNPTSDIGVMNVVPGVYLIPDQQRIPSMDFRSEALSELRNELLELKERVSKPDWDDEGAKPVDESTFKAALEFVKLLSVQQMQETEVDATALGEILLSWDSEDEIDSFNVIVQPSGDISVAGIFDKLKVHGPVDSSVVSRVFDLLKWIFSTNGTMNKG